MVSLVVPPPPFNSHTPTNKHTHRVDTAFGAYWGFQESFWSWGSCVVDNALYPVLAYETFIAMYQGNVASPMNSDSLEQVNSWWFAYTAKLVLTVVFSMPVILGKTEWVAHGMSIMIVLLTIPFAIMLPYIVYTRPMDWSQLLRSKPGLFDADSGIDWVGLLHVTFWNYNGFDCASTCAGEVKNPGKAYPQGLLSALVVVVAMTFIPLCVATAANTPKWESWDVGWWSAIADQSAGRGFAWSVVFSSLIGTFGMHAAVMWEDAWQLCGMAEQGLAPKWLAGRNEKLGTPENATLMSMAAVCFLVMFDFRSMVIVDNFFSVASGLLEIAAFAHCKRSRPDLRRPYSIPGIHGDFSLFLFLLAPVSVGIMILITSFDNGWTSMFTLIPFILIGFALPKLFQQKSVSSTYTTTIPEYRLDGVRKQFLTMDGDVVLPTMMEKKRSMESLTDHRAPTTAVGGVYGALNLNHKRAYSRDSSSHFGSQHLQITSSKSADQITPAGYSPTPKSMREDHIFDETVRFGSIFTDPKQNLRDHFFREDDELGSFSGRFQDFEDGEDIGAVSHMHNGGGADDDDVERRYRRRLNHRETIDEEYIHGTDEERSYDDGVGGETGEKEDDSLD